MTRLSAIERYGSYDSSSTTRPVEDFLDFDNQPSVRTDSHWLQRERRLRFAQLCHRLGRLAEASLP